MGSKIRFCDPKGGKESLVSAFLEEKGEERMWRCLLECWSDDPHARPGMRRVWEVMEGLYAEGKERRAGTHLNRL